jgi:hypothetical protein
MAEEIPIIDEICGADSVVKKARHGLALAAHILIF